MHGWNASRRPCTRQFPTGGMTEPVTLRPGQTSLRDWRAVYRGAPVTLDPVSRADVEAGAAAFEAIAARQDQPKPVENGKSGPAVVELLHKDGHQLPAAIVRLFVALKTASLAQGMSGVRWELIQRLCDCLVRDLLPPVPASNPSDRLALSHLFGTLTGTGEVASGTRRPSAKALKNAGLLPIKLKSQERSALLSGTQLTTALALAGLFEAERVLQSALVATAVSMSALGEGERLVHPRVHKLHRQRGQIEIASAIRMLIKSGASAIREGTAESSAEWLGAAQVIPRMGACLDLLRQAGTTLESAANSVSEDRLVFWQTEEVVTGLDDPSAMSFAADQIAVALREIGTMAERRIPALPGGGDNAEQIGANGNASTPGAMAASFNAESHERVHAAEPGEESAASVLPADVVRRLLPMAGTAALIVAIELLVANRGRGEQHPNEPGAIGAVHALLRERIPGSEGENGVPAADLATAAELVRSGELAAAPGFDLPSVIAPYVIPERTKDSGRAAPRT